MGVNKPIVIANWKMNINQRDIDRLVVQLKGLPDDVVNKLDIAVCPPFVYLQHTLNLIQGSFIKAGSQNIFWEERGAFTGEVSGQMVTELGAQYVILGHSERRKYFGETDEVINKKIKISLKNHLTPIVCIGENLEQKNQGLTKKVVEDQLMATSQDLTGYELKKIIFAYEPVWAISTSEENKEGKADNPEETQVIHKYIKKLIGGCYSQDVARHAKTIYGGSVNLENIAAFAKMPDIDGVLVGSASLSPFKFTKIIEEFAKNKS